MTLHTHEFPRLTALALAAVSLFATPSARGGEPLPAPVKGVVTLVKGHTYTVTEATDLSSVTQQISVVEGSTLEYDISSGKTLTVPCRVKGKGNVVKNGPGLVINSLSGSYDHYIENPGSIIINDGTLRGPSIPGQYTAYYLGRLVINSPGVYDSAYNGNSQVYGLWGDGTLTCTRSGGCNQLNIATDQGKSGETYRAPSQFTGLISGDTLRLVPNGYFDILSTNNTCNGAPVLNTGANIGLMSFGKSGQPASLGKPNFCSRGNEVKFRYLGTTGETVTKNFGCDIACGNYTLDAGTYGGLVLAGTINMRQLASGYATHTFIMTGDHSTPCSVTGPINETYTSSSKTYRGPIAFKKTGTGTWRMASGTKGDYCGLVSVENGTLEYADVAPKGTNSSLGNATNTTDYAILLGSSATVGTFSYVGTSKATVTTRPIALTGKGGRLVADAGILEWTGISSVTESTLCLAGDANTNVARTVSGATSVVKEGAGTWVLDGDNLFAGTITVNGGTLDAKGFQATAENPAATVGWLSNVTKATVSTGATLHVVGKVDFPIVEMAGGTLLVDSGTTNAFAQPIVSGANSSLKIPTGSKVTLGDSRALTWPADGRLYITTEGDGTVEFLGLSELQKMQVYVNGVALYEKETEVVAFLGDAITSDGYYEYFLQDFEVSRHPGKNIRLLNCGISGDTAGGALLRLETDVFARNPDRVAILFGMNDVGLSDYCENPTAAQKTAQARSLATFAQNLTNLVDRITERGIDVTLITPTPYDEYTPSNETFVAATNYKTANEKGLAAVAKIVRDLANARGLTLVDLHAPMTDVYKTSSTHFNRADRIHPEESGHALMSLLVWRQFGFDKKPYSDQTIFAGGGYVCTNYAPSGLPFASAESLAAAKEAIPSDYAAMNREFVRFSDLPSAMYALYLNGSSSGTYSGSELAYGLDFVPKATPSHEQSDAAWAKMKSMVVPDQKLRSFVMLEIRAKTYDPSVDVTDFNAVTNALEKWYLTLTSQQAYYRSLINLYEAEKPNQAAIEEEVTAKWCELRRLGVPQPYELELKQEGLVEIPPNKGEVELSVDQLESAAAIYIGTNSCLVITNHNTEATTIAIPGNICGPGGWFVWNAYVNIQGDNRGFTGWKIFTNAFVTVSSRYGLGSPSVELKNYVIHPTGSTGGNYLHFAGNGLTNDVPVLAVGSYCPDWPATGFTVDCTEPLVMNGGLSAPDSRAFHMGSYVLAGGLYGNSVCRIEACSPCDIWLTGPVNVTADSAYLPVTSSARLHIRAHPDSVRWQTWLYPLEGGTVICESADIWGESLALGQHEGQQSKSSGTLDMNGFDQTFRQVTFCQDETSVRKSWTDLKLCVTSALPATLTMTTGSSNRQGIRFMGAAGLRFAGEGAWTNVLFRSETTGTLTVGDGTNAGEVFFDWGACWGGDVVLNGGRFGCDTSKGLAYRSEVTVMNGGQLIVPNGVTLHVAKVIVDGTPLLKGTFRNVPWIAGGGSVQCGRIGFTMVLRKPR